MILLLFFFILTHVISFPGMQPILIQIHKICLRIFHIPLIPLPSDLSSILSQVCVRLSPEQKPLIITLHTEDCEFNDKCNP